VYERKREEGGWGRGEEDEEVELEKNSGQNKIESIAFILCRVVQVKWQSLLNEIDAAVAAATILQRSVLITPVVYAASLGTVVGSRCSKHQKIEFIDNGSHAVLLARSLIPYG